MDFLDLFNDFAAHYPALMVRGQPRSWRHYIYGVSTLDRRRARESLRMASATSISQAADKDQRDNWYAIHRNAAGY